MRSMRQFVLLLFLLLLPLASAAGEPEWPVIETGRAGFYWSFSLRTNPESVPPGGTIASEARWAEPPLAGSMIWYFAGVSGQTVHLFVIFQEFSKSAARVIEIERRPILLTLDSEEVATLTLLPLHAKPAVLKLKRNGDESLTVSVQPK
jgi:hypothetical protein